MAQAVFPGPRLHSNHRRRTAARQPLPLKAHPTVTKLESWEDFQRIALFPGAPFRPFELDDDFRPFLGGDPWLFEQEGYVATIFGNALPHLLLMASERRWKHKPACGGWLHANLFTKADLEQGWADLEDLKRRSSISLCELLGEELRVYFRLLRAAQRGWWYNPGGFDWEPRWRSANRVLERILHICAELRRRANRWFAELCLRQELFGLWRAEFGPNVELTDEAARWIGQEGIPEEAEAAERAILYRLLVERKAGHAIPLCCRWLVRLWEQGKVYQEVQVA